MREEYMIIAYLFVYKSINFCEWILIKTQISEVYAKKVVFAISNKKSKTSELLLTKYIKTTELFVIESHHQVHILKLQSYNTA